MSRWLNIDTDLSDFEEKKAETPSVPQQQPQPQWKSCKSGSKCEYLNARNRNRCQYKHTKEEIEQAKQQRNQVARCHDRARCEYLYARDGNRCRFGHTDLEKVNAKRWRNSQPRQQPRRQPSQQPSQQRNQVARCHDRARCEYLYATDGNRCRFGHTALEKVNAKRWRNSQQRQQPRQQRKQRQQPRQQPRQQRNQRQQPRQQRNQRQQPRPL